MKCDWCDAGPFKNEDYLITHQRFHNLFTVDRVIMDAWGECKIPVSLFIDKDQNKLREYLNNYKPDSYKKYNGEIISINFKSQIDSYTKKDIM